MVIFKITMILKDTKEIKDDHFLSHFFISLSKRSLRVKMILQKSF